MSNLRLWGYESPVSRSTTSSNTNLSSIMEKLGRLRETNQSKAQEIDELENTIENYARQLTEYSSQASTLRTLIDAAVAQLGQQSEDMQSKYQEQQAKLQELSVAHEHEANRLWTELESLGDNELHLASTFDTLKAEMKAVEQSVSSKVQEVNLLQDTLTKSVSKTTAKLGQFENSLETLSVGLQTITRRFHELETVKQYSVIQLTSAKRSLEATKAVRFKNRETHYTFPFNMKLKRINIYAPASVFFGFEIKLQSTVLVSAYGPFPKEFEVDKLVKKGEKISFIPNTPLSQGLYAELICENWDGSL